MKRTDVVFTGGPPLYEAKRNLHPRVHYLPGAVDAEHFPPARPPGCSPTAPRPSWHRRCRARCRTRGWASTA